MVRTNRVASHAMRLRLPFFFAQSYTLAIDQLRPALILKQQGQSAVHQHAEFQLPLVNLQVGHKYKNLPERNC